MPAIFFPLFPFVFLPPSFPCYFRIIFYHRLHNAFLPSFSCSLISFSHHPFPSTLSSPLPFFSPFVITRKFCPFALFFPDPFTCLRCLLPVLSLRVLVYFSLFFLHLHHYYFLRYFFLFLIFPLFVHFLIPFLRMYLSFLLCFFSPLISLSYRSSFLLS